MTVFLCNKKYDKCFLKVFSLNANLILLNWSVTFWMYTPPQAISVANWNKDLIGSYTEKRHLLFTQDA